MTASGKFDLQKLSALNATAGLNRLAGFDVVLCGDGTATCEALLVPSDA